MIARIRAEFDRQRLLDAALVALAVIPYALGWLVGVIVRLSLWIVAAVVAGYKAGRSER